MWPNPQFPADVVTFTEEILDGKLHFLCYETKKNLASGNAGETRAAEKKTLFDKFNWIFSINFTLKKLL